MSNYTDLNYQDAHDFVSKNKYRGFYWDGWTIVKWTKNPNGYSQTNGSFKNNEWGYEVRIPVSNKGTWKVLTKYV